MVVTEVEYSVGNPVCLVQLLQGVPENMRLTISLLHIRALMNKLGHGERAQ